MPGASRKKVMKSFFRTLFTIARRQFQRDDAGQRHQRQPQFKEVETAPFIGLQQFGGKEARQGMASDEPVMPMVSPFRRWRAGQACTW
jgi:hypothetical protein